MDSTWTLLEYRPGRYIKVTPEGRFMGLATEAEVRAWFEAQGIELEPSPASDPLTPSFPAAPRSALDEVVIWGPKPRPEHPRDIADTPPEPPKLQPELEPQPDVVEEPPLTPPPDSLLDQAHGADAGIEPEILIEEPSPAPELPVSHSPPARRSAADEVVIWGPTPGREPQHDLDETPAETSEYLPTPELPTVQADEPVATSLPPRPESEPQPLPSQAQEPPPESGPEAVAAHAGEDRLEPEPEISPVEMEKPPSTPESLPTQSEQPALVVQAELPLDEPEPPTTVPAVAPLPPRSQGPSPMLEAQPSAIQPDEPLRAPPASKTSAGEAELPPVEAEPKVGDEQIEIASIKSQPKAPPDVLQETPPAPGDEPIAKIEVESIPDEVEIPAAEPGRDSPHHFVKKVPSVAEVEPLHDPPVQVFSAQEVNGTPAGKDALDRWLWVDPRHESGYSPAAFDLVAFLRRATVLFRSKPWTGGRPPGRLMVHPDQLADGLLEVARDLNLDVVTDPTVTVGTYRLALSEQQES